MRACNLPQIYNYSRSVRLPTPNAQLAEFPLMIFINTTNNYIGMEGGGWWEAMKWWVTAEYNNFKVT